MAPSLILLLVQAGLQYGPQFVMDIEKLINNPSATVADVVAAFSNLKPYSAYGIPDVAPTSPVQLSSVTTPTNIPGISIVKGV